MLTERLELESPHGRKIIGILLFQDLAVVPLLVLIPALGAGGERLMSELAVALVKAAIDHGGHGEIFVPAIPSWTMQHLADQLGPDCTIEETGLRDGEKLHEQLISDEEVSRTYDCGDHFRIAHRPAGLDHG